ncbi:hypothetical protein MPSEU_000785200 [Mayamaea pseudoterrestris]|nr:hypothetical protein MPSEU_000785200 [Mayamaea pseudoterrestris]
MNDSVNDGSNDREPAAEPFHGGNGEYLNEASEPIEQQQPQQEVVVVNTCSSTENIIQQPILSVEAAAAELHEATIEEPAAVEKDAANTTGNLILAYGQPSTPTSTAAAAAAAALQHDDHEPIPLANLQSQVTPHHDQDAAKQLLTDDGSDKKRKDAPTGTTDVVTTKRPRATPTRVNWEDRLAMLEAYRLEHGNLLIPIRYKENPSLGKFVHNTREQYKLYHKLTPEGYKKKCSLTADKIAQLDDLGFVWSTERSRRQKEDWNARFQQLQRYKQVHGNTLVPHGFPADPSFAEWIHRQRTTYATHLKEGRKNRMVEERMRQLEELGFHFRVHVDKWEDHYRELQMYSQQNGNTMVPTHYAQNPKLGRWVHTQRHQRRQMLKGKKSSMTPARTQLLDQLGFSWEVRQTLAGPRHTWRQRFSQCEDFFKVHGHFLIPPAEMPELWAWCVEQKLRLMNLHRHGTDATRTMKTKMSQERVALLANLGFTKDVDLALAVEGFPTPVLPDDEDDEEEDEEDDDDDEDENADDGTGGQDHHEPLDRLGMDDHGQLPHHHQNNQIDESQLTERDYHEVLESMDV